MLHLSEQRLRFGGREVEEFFSSLYGKTEYCSTLEGNMSIAPLDVLVGVETMIELQEPEAKGAFIRAGFGNGVCKLDSVPDGVRQAICPLKCEELLRCYACH